MNLRYGLRYYILYLMTIRQNVGFIWVTNKADAQMYLQGSNKGNFIETKISRNAWKPIFSLESENGETWTLLKERLAILMKQLPSNSVLDAIVYKHTDKQGAVITSREISLMTICIFVEYLFGDSDHTQNCLDLYEASLEFRKEIALKGWGDMTKKQRAVNIIREYIRSSKYGLPDDIYSISVIMQPFIISPAINVSDVAIHWDLRKDVTSNIVYNHPFPILEREIVQNGRKYQVFIPTDELHILPFGYGIRQCSGKMIATRFLETFFENLISKNIYMPREKHIYSGRDNDGKDGIEATLFQIRTMVTLFW